MKIYEVSAREPELLQRIVCVWEASVRATHHFLSEEELQAIKKYVPQALEQVAHLLVVQREDGSIAAFMGVENGRLEMLFLAPEERGKGLGKSLLQYGIERYRMREVTVNEQNPQAVGFYEHCGFAVYRRTTHDEEGNPYPLLYLRLRGTV